MIRIRQYRVSNIQQPRRAGRTNRRWVAGPALTVIGVILTFGHGPEVSARSGGEALPKFIAFCSDRPGGAGSFDLYLYDVIKKVVIPLPATNTPGMEAHPSLYDKGNRLAFTSERHDAKPRPGGIYLYDRRRNQLTEPPNINGATTVGTPNITADGKLIAVSRFRNESTPAGEPTLRDILLYSVPEKRFITPEAAIHPAGNALLFNVSGDGRWLVWNTSTEGKWGSLLLYDRREGKIVPDPGLELRGEVSFPTFNRDGRYLAFSNRQEEGAGIWNLRVFDRKERRYMDTPGLNAPGRNDFCSLSAGGRYLAFETDRGGNFDIMLYDLKEKLLVDLPGLNTGYKERHPSLCRD